MASEGVIKLSMKKWLNEELGFTWIFEEQAQSRPSVRPYGTIRIMSSEQVGGDDYKNPVDSQGNRILKGVRRGIISLNIYGPSAVEKMMIARDSMFKVSNIDKLWNTYGISTLSTGNLQNLTGLLETDFEERAQMDVNILFARNISDETGLIEHVEITGEAEGHIVGPEIIDLP
jgi:hypothetical protein